MGDRDAHVSMALESAVMLQVKCWCYTFFKLFTHVTDFAYAPKCAWCILISTLKLSTNLLPSSVNVFEFIYITWYSEFTIYSEMAQNSNQYMLHKSHVSVLNVEINPFLWLGGQDICYAI